MDQQARRTFLKEMTALAAASLPGIAAAKTSAYDPKARLEIKVSEVPFRRNEHGRQLMARIYQPVSSNAGAGPFPTLLDLHGGAHLSTGGRGAISCRARSSRWCLE